jgi:hypothetical protein
LIAITVYLQGGLKFYTIFYRLLVALLIAQTCHLISSLSIYIGQRMDIYWFQLAFSYFLYPVPSMMLHISTFLTILLAWNRHEAARNPLDYFVAWRFANPTGIVLKHLK